MKAVQVLSKAFQAIHDDDALKQNRREETFMSRNRLPPIYSEMLVIPIPYAGRVRAVYFGVGIAGSVPNFWMCVKSDKQQIEVTRSNIHLLRKPVRYKQ